MQDERKTKREGRQKPHDDTSSTTEMARHGMPVAGKQCRKKGRIMKRGGVINTERREEMMSVPLHFAAIAKSNF